MKAITPLLPKLTKWPFHALFRTSAVALCCTKRWLVFETIAECSQMVFGCKPASATGICCTGILSRRRGVWLGAGEAFGSAEREHLAGTAMRQRACWRVGVRFAVLAGRLARRGSTPPKYAGHLRLMLLPAGEPVLIESRGEGF